MKKMDSNKIICTRKLCIDLESNILREGRQMI